MFGVREGYGLTILPDGVSYPNHWHIAEEAKKGTDELFQSFQNAFYKWQTSLD
jgi:hypothetical protein